MIDFEEIIDQRTDTVINQVLDTIWAPLSKGIKVKKEVLLLDLKNYFQINIQKCKNVKILCHKHEPIDLTSIYVPTRFEIQGRYHTEDEVNKLITENQRVVVKGSGGSGKTFYLKHLWLTILDSHVNNERKIPIFVELRDLRLHSTKNILTLSLKNVLASTSLSAESAEELCRKGSFTFIFDAFDELNREDRQQIEKQILELSDKYPKCGFVVSGRDDERFYSWRDFRVFNVAPMTLETTRELVSKIPYQKKSKETFLSAIDEEFYDENFVFVSNPLLCIMVLMVFSESFTMPDQFSEFYKEAYETLIKQHDALKGFERDMELTKEKFRQFFTVFCILSYLDHRFKFTEESLLDFIGLSLQFCDIEADELGVEKDIRESANLLVKDGNVYNFIHRSFQEYFSAVAATQIDAFIDFEVYSAFFRRPHDKTLRMSYELRDDIVEGIFVEPMAKKLNIEQLVEEISSERKNATASFYGVSVEYTVTKRLRSRSRRGSTSLQFYDDVDGVIDGHGGSQAIDDLFNLANIFARSARKESLQYFLDIELKTTRGVRLPPGVDEVRLRISCLFDDGNLSLSVRNVGKQKLPIERLRDFKKKLHAVLTSDMAELDAEVFAAAKQILVCLEKGKKEREEKKLNVKEFLKKKRQR